MNFGEMLNKLNRKEEAISAYKRSLESNSENENAKMFLKKMG